MDFIPTFKTFSLAADTYQDISDLWDKGVRGVMFSVAVTATLSDGTNTVTYTLDADEPIRIPETCTQIKTDVISTMKCGAQDNAAVS